MKAFVPFALIALAEFEAEQKNPTEAIKLTEQALPLAKSGHSPRALYTAELDLAKWYADQGKTTEANNLADQSRLSDRSTVPTRRRLRGQVGRGRTAPKQPPRYRPGGRGPPRGRRLQ